MSPPDKRIKKIDISTCDRVGAKASNYNQIEWDRILFKVKILLPLHNKEIANRKLKLN